MKAVIQKVILLILFIVTAITVLIVPEYNGTILDWATIPLPNWARYCSAILLSLFLPGYYILKIFDKKNSFNNAALIVLSNLLSIFVSFSTGFILLITNNSIATYGTYITLAVNLILLVLYLVLSKAQPVAFSLCWKESKILAIIIPVIIIVSILMLTNTLPINRWDMANLHQYALELTKGFPVYGGKLMIYQAYLYHISLANLFALSGIQSVLTEQFLLTLSFIPVLSFFCLLKSWFNEHKIVNTAVIFSTLTGFGGLYVLYLCLSGASGTLLQLAETATTKTYDISMRVLFLPDIVAPLWAVGLPAFLMLLCLIKLKMPMKLKGGLISILFAIAYLGHIAEGFLFITLLLVYILIFREKENIFSPSIIIGLLIVALVDYAAPVQTYVTGSVYWLSWAIAFSLVTIEIILKYRIKINLFRLKYLILKVAPLIPYLILYLYSLFFIIWLILHDNFNIWNYGAGNGAVPFFVLPLRLGAVGLLAVLTILFYFSKILKDNRLLFFFSLLILGFLLEQIANIYPLYPAYRFATITFIGACVISAYGVTQLLKTLKHRKKIITVILLLFLIFSSLSSTVLAYYTSANYSTYKNVSREELQAVDYLKYNLPQNASFLTFTEESSGIIEHLAGINAVQDAGRWIKLLDTTNPYLTINILASSNVKYIYVAERDSSAFTSSKLACFTQYFTKVVDNSAITLYEVPKLTTTTDNLAGQEVILPYTWVADFQQGWHLSQTYGNITKSNIDTQTVNSLVLQVTSNQSGTVWIDYSYPLNVTTKNSVLSFNYKTSDDNSWFSIIIRNASHGLLLCKTHLSAKDSTQVILNLPDNQEIMQIDILVGTSVNGTTATATLSNLNIHTQTYSANDTQIAFFSSLLSANTTQSIEEPPYYNSFSGAITLKGNLELTTNNLITNNQTYNGNIKIKFINSTLLLSPEESYMRVSSNESTTAQVIINGTEITLPLASGIRIKLPNATATGIIIFNELDAHSSPYKSLAGIYQTETAIEGTVTFSTAAISDPITLLLGFNATGKIYATNSQDTMTNIQWTKILFSPIFIIYNLILLTAIIVTVKRRKMIERPSYATG